MQIQFNQWQSINLQDFASSFQNISNSVKDTDNTLTSLAPQSIFFYDGSNSTGYGWWGGYDIFVRGSNFLGSSPRANFVRLTDFGEKYELNGSINISNTVWGYGINGGTFSSLSHTNSGGIKDYVITGAFTYSALGTINGASITSVEINQSNGKLLLKGTLNLDANEVITGGNITSISYTAPDGKSFAISNISINVADLQSVLQGAGSSSDFSTLSSFFLNSANLTGNDTIIGDIEANILDGAGGVDTLIGGLGDDTYIVDLTRTGTTAANFKVALQDTIIETPLAGSGTDTVQLRLLAGTDYSAMANATTLTLGANLENFDASLTADTKLNLTGNALANTLTGNDANNILDGGAGVDTLIGGEGDDTYVLDLKTATINGVVTAVVEDIVTETGGTTNGIDTIKLRGTATLATATTLALDGQWANAEILDASATGATKLNLTGNNLGNTLIGNAAANTLTGGTGNDILNGGAGIDTMIGGAGNDIYIVDNINDVVTELVNGGTDEVQASVTYSLALAANVENLTLTGTAAINGTGNDDANIISGNAGNNILDGKGGADTLIGGKGNDTYIVDDEDDEVVENLNEGIDLVKASVSYTLSANVENLTLTDGSANGGTAALDGTGNALANTITGIAGSNTLDGGDGVDKLVGGNGDDTYIVDLTRTGTTAANFKVALQDTITETPLAGSGTDTVQLRLLASTDYSAMANATTLTLGANLENFDALLTADTKLNLTGNALANTLTGNDANNILDGGAGVDTLIGGEGDDTYVLDLKTATINGVVTAVVEDIVTETGGTTNGIDTIKLRGTATLATATTLALDSQWANAEILDASATGATKLNLTGNNLGNTLIGNAAANTLTGGTGNDILNGGAGIDTMIGGAGNDIYIVDNINDVVTELVNGGTDEVQASVTYSLALAANVENLTLTGTAAINGTGNDDANIISGNAGNNILDGKGGADTLIGGKGNDTYIVDDEDDEVVENLNEGIDLVKASVSYTLSANVENLTLTDGSANGGTAALDGTGNALANTLTGNAGSNVLDGGDGVDKLIGGNGDDTYIVDLTRTGTAAANYKVALQDTITETAVAGSGTDTVQLRLLAGTDYSLMANATTLTLGANLENFDASATGTTKLNLTGNALANTLTGNDADNILDGGAGNDILIGGLGSDTLKGGAGADVFQYVNAADSTASSMDTILDFTPGVDKLDFLILNGGGFDLSFSGITESANSIWYSHSQGNTFIFADTSGDAIADFQLQLTGTVDLNSFDFYLPRTTTRFGTNADDSITMDSQTDTYYGLAGNDFITGNFSFLTDTIFGQDGDDILFGRGGSDVMDGGSGNDTFLYSSEIQHNDSVDTILNFKASEDKFQFNESYPYFKELKGAVDDDEVRIGAGYVSAIDDNDYIIYNTSTGDVFYDYDANGPQMAIKFANLVNPTGTITYLNFTVLMSGQTLIGTNNADTLTASSTSSDDYIFGGNGDDIINGNGSVYGDNLFGGDGNDTISGSGYAYMAGGKGNDTYYAGPYSTISEHENEGEDTIVFLGYGIAYTLEDTPNVENLVFPNSIGNGLTDTLLIGNALNNKLTGNDYVNTLIGNEGNDRLNAGAGDDILWGGLGNDVLIGGSGADTFKWFLPDAVNLGNVANNTDTVTDFSIADEDTLDLRDLLTGESSNNILQYLDISMQGSSTEIRISSTGNFTGGNYNLAEEDVRIVLSNTNLYTATGTNNEAQLIGYLTQHNNLLIDSSI